MGRIVCGLEPVLNVASDVGRVVASDMGRVGLEPVLNVDSDVGRVVASDIGRVVASDMGRMGLELPHERFDTPHRGA